MLVVVEAVDTLILEEQVEMVVVDGETQAISVGADLL
jgi:hypothetical protein